MRWGMVMCAVFLIAASAWPRGAATIPSAQESAIAGILQRLGNENYAIREAAQRELELLTFESYEDLSRLAAKQTDAEVLARIQGKLKQFVEERAVSPPPVSVRMRGVRASQLGAELGRQSGVAVEIASRGEDPDDSFSLEMEHKPFWSVVRALDQQHGLKPTEPRGLLAGGPAGRLGISEIHGGVLVFAIARRQVDRDHLGNPRETVLLTTGIAADPRMKVVAYTPAQLGAATDDAGNVLLAPREMREFSTRNEGGALVWESTLAVASPAHPGRNVRASGRAAVVVSVKEERGVIEDAAAQVGKEISVGGRAVSVTQFEPDGEFIHVRATATGDGLDPRPVTFLLRNAEGVVVLRQTGGGMAAGTIPRAAGMKGPCRMEVIVHMETKGVEMPFEFARIPIE